MRRREFITLLGGAAAAWSISASAQQTDRVRRIGVIISLAATDPEAQQRKTAFDQGLQELGWTDGRNVQIEYRWGAGDASNVHKYAAELIALAARCGLAVAPVPPPSRLHEFRIWRKRKIAGDTQRDRAGRDASGSPSRFRKPPRDRPVGCHSGSGAGGSGGVEPRQCAQRR